MPASYIMPIAKQTINQSITA